MTNEIFKSSLQTIGLSKKEFATNTNISINTINGWTQKGFPAWLDKYINLLNANKRLIRIISAKDDYIEVIEERASEEYTQKLSNKIDEFQAQLRRDHANYSKSNEVLRDDLARIKTEKNNLKEEIEALIDVKDFIKDSKIDINDIKNLREVYGNKRIVSYEKTLKENDRHYNKKIKELKEEIVKLKIQEKKDITRDVTVDLSKKLINSRKDIDKVLKRLGYVL